MSDKKTTIVQINRKKNVIFHCKSLPGMCHLKGLKSFSWLTAKCTIALRSCRWYSRRKVSPRRYSARPAISAGITFFRAQLLDKSPPLYLCLPRCGEFYRAHRAILNGRGSFGLMQRYSPEARGFYRDVMTCARPCAVCANSHRIVWERIVYRVVYSARFQKKNYQPAPLARIVRRFEQTCLLLTSSAY